MNTIESYTSELLKYYNISNTPYFLYRKIKNSTFFQAVSEENSPEILKSKLREIFDKEAFEPEDVAIAYGLIVALGSTNTLDPEEDYFTRLTWTNEIYNYIKQDLNNTKTLYITKSNQTNNLFNQYFSGFTGQTHIINSNSIEGPIDKSHSTNYNYSNTE